MTELEQYMRNASLVLVYIADQSQAFLIPCAGPRGVALDGCHVPEVDHGRGSKTSELRAQLKRFLETRSSPVDVPSVQGYVAHAHQAGGDGDPRSMVTVDRQALLRQLRGALVIALSMCTTTVLEECRADTRLRTDVAIQGETFFVQRDRTERIVARCPGDGQ